MHRSCLPSAYNLQGSFRPSAGLAGGSRSLLERILLLLCFCPNTHCEKCKDRGDTLTNEVHLRGVCSLMLELAGIPAGCHKIPDQTCLLNINSQHRNQSSLIASGNRLLSEVWVHYVMLQLLMTVDTVFEQKLTAHMLTPVNAAAHVLEPLQLQYCLPLDLYLFFISLSLLEYH